MTSPAPRSDLRIAETARAAERSRSGGAWSLAHLPWTWLTLLSAGAVLALIAGLVSGGRALVGVGVGIGIVGLFFTLSTLVVARVGARRPKSVLVAALVTYAVKVIALGVVMTVMPRDGVVDTRWMAGAIGVGLFAWLGAHLRFVWTAKIFYVDPH